jgi:hypothetical protein
MKTHNSQLTTHNSQLTTHNSQLTTHNSQLTTQFSTLLILSLMLLLSVRGWGTDIPYNGGSQNIITTNTVWNDPSYDVYDDIVILNGATLTISPGTQIVFHNNQSSSSIKGNASKTGIFIETGSLNSIGNSNSYITYTPNNNNLVLGWEGINFINTNNLNSYASFIKYSIVEGVNKNGIYGCPGNAETNGAILLHEFNNLVIENSIIRNNTVNALGGGISIVSYTLNSMIPIMYPIIRNNEIHNNSATRGGGICILNKNNITFTSTIEYNNLHDNVATLDGGGLALINHVKANLSYNNISNNSALCLANSSTPQYTGGGGLVIGLSSDVSLYRNTISNNSTFFNPTATNDITGLGGGILVRLGSTSNIEENSIFGNIANQGAGLAVFGKATNSPYYGNPSSVNCINNEFIENQATSNGGAVSFNHSYGLIKNNTFSENTASFGAVIHAFASTYDASTINNPIQIYNNFLFHNHASICGGAIYIEGEVLQTNPAITKTEIINNLIHNNTSVFYAAGVFLSTYIDAKIHNNTIVNNQSTNSTNIGDGLYIIDDIDNCEFFCANNIIYYNGSNSKHCQIFYDLGFGDMPFFNNDIMNLVCQLPPVQENVDIIPDFVDPINYDFRLFSYSPLIDFGLPNVQPVSMFDLDMQNRINGHIDIGAYEYVGTVPRKAKPLDSVATNIIIISPNPCSDFLSVNSNWIITNIQLISMDGRLIFETKPLLLSTLLNISEYEAGVYFLKISSNEQTSTQKIIKN